MLFVFEQLRIYGSSSSLKYQPDVPKTNRHASSNITKHRYCHFPRITTLFPYYSLTNITVNEHYITAGICIMTPRHNMSARGSQLGGTLRSRGPGLTVG